jgi:beta-lactamase regulating signal transducer with metallopeptidase domain
MTLSAWGWALLHFGWQAPVVGASLALCLRAAGARPARRGALAFLALLALFALPFSDLVVIGLKSAPAAVAAGNPAAAPGLAAAYAAVAPATRTIALVWLVLASFFVARWLGGWWFMRRLARRGTKPARAPWAAALETAAQRIGVRRGVEILESESIGVPTLVGVRHPVIIVPGSACADLGPQEMAGILAHELAHVQRHDALANLVQSLIEAMFFFHPVVWWASRQVREEREASCDDIAAHAVGDRRLYARALARLAMLHAAGPRLALAASAGSLIDRLERLTAARTTSRSPGAAALVASGAGGLVVLAALSAALLPATLTALSAPLVPSWYVVHATDPAGAFTVRVEQGRIVRAVVNGVRVPAERIVQHGDSVVLPWAGGRFALRLLPAGGLSWTARTP